MRAGDYSLLISPFHTGHLGFRPTIDVSLQLLVASRSSTAYAELVVSPLSRSSADTAVLTAVMRDEVGVVERLVNAIAELEINIDAQDSASIGHLDRHSVTLFLDLDALKDTPVRPGDTVTHGIYRDYAAYVPLHDHRCRRIFETVMRHCADVLAVRRDGLMPTLDFSLRLLAREQNARPATETLVAAPNQYVRLPIPKALHRPLRNAQRPNSDEDLDYLFLSDTDDRSLRVFFLPGPTARSIYHVAVHHRDRPRALGVLLSLTAAARFNILTSLVRKGDKPDENVWEAVLEYRGADDARPARPGPEVENPEWFAEHALPWLRDELAGAITDPAQAAGFDFVLRAPSYPRPADGASTPMPLIVGAPVAVPQTVSPAPDHSAQIEQRRSQIAQLQNEETEMRLAILDQIEQRTGMARVYFAYTACAGRHAKIIRDRLCEHFHIVKREITTAKGQSLSDQAKEVAACDFVICLWHHDKYWHDGSGAFGGTPWAHFVFGLAVASGKPSLVVRSSDADPTIWPSWLDGPAHIAYDDLEFASDTVGLIEKYCLDHFVLDDD